MHSLFLISMNIRNMLSWFSINIFEKIMWTWKKKEEERYLRNKIGNIIMRLKGEKKKI